MTSSADDAAGEPPTPLNDERLARLLGPGIELPPQGTGARAARREAKTSDAPETVPPTGGGDPVAPAAAPRPLRADSPTPAVPPLRTTWQRWRWTAYVASLTSLVLAGVVLSVAGYRVVRDSTAGRTIDPTLDPEDPGFEAFVQPTPTMLLLARDGAGDVGGAALLATGAEGTGGSVVVLPTRLLVGEAGAERPLDEVVDEDGPEEARAAVADRLGLGVAEVADLEPPELADLVGAAAPIDLRSDGTAPGFPAGELSLGAEEAAAYLVALGDGEGSEEQRLERQEALWDALAEALADAGPDAVPGERGAGIGRFLHGLATGASPAETLPSNPQEAEEGLPVYAVDTEAMGFVLADAVPFPTAAEPGGRTRVRLLDGTGDPDLPLVAAPRLAAIGAEIVIIGNATSFERTKTEVIHHAPDLSFVAKVFAFTLGTEVFREEVQPTDSYDVTIVLGADFAASSRRPTTTTERSHDPG